jgi:hypothetical protein
MQSLACAIAVFAVFGAAIGGTLLAAAGEWRRAATAAAILAVSLAVLFNAPDSFTTTPTPEPTRVLIIRNGRILDCRLDINPDGTADANDCRYPERS